MSGSNIIMKQVHVIFEVFAVLFYFATIIFLAFFSDKWFDIDPAMKVIICVSFGLWGTNRAFQTYKHVKQYIILKQDDDDDDDE